jgi:hypothetical protein
LDDQEALKAAVHEAFRRGEWARVASRRADFQGAERGVDEAISGAAGRRFQRHGQERHLGRLRCAMAGGTWPQARLAAAGLRRSRMECEDF